MRWFGIAVAVVACSSSNASSDPTPQGTPSSCDLTVDLGYCLDFGPDVPQDTAKLNCQNAKNGGNEAGVLNETGACPTVKRTGSCDATLSDIAVTFRYYANRFNPTTAKESCNTLGGTGGAFTPDN